LQLGLIVAWSWMFFGIHRSGWSMVELLLLMGFMVMCIKVFSASSRGAALMMIPGLLWVMYLWALNIAVWVLNGGGLGSVMS
jgi:tryptophan-rich sensory protein